MRLMELLLGSSQDIDRTDELEERLGQVEAEVVQLRTTVELQRCLIRALRDVNADMDGRMP